MDASLIDKYSLFVLEVVKAHVAKAPKYPKTIHYRGDGVFMVSGENTGAVAQAVPAGDAVSAAEATAFVPSPHP